MHAQTRFIAALLILAALLVLPVGRPAARGQDLVDPDDADLFHDAMLAYRLGHYYLVKGDYERAVIKLTEAINLIPQEVFLAAPAYGDMYWTLGAAQEGAGMVVEALASYQRFVVLVGDDAAPWVLVKVRFLEFRVARWRLAANI